MAAVFSSLLGVTKTSSIVLLLSSFLIPELVGADEGKDLFQKNCAACHTLTFEGPQRQGPALVRVIGRKAGSVRNFPYSKGLREAGWEWTPNNLEKWVENPQEMVPDSYMLYRQQDPIIRSKIVKFLSISSNNRKGS